MSTVETTNNIIKYLTLCGHYPHRNHTTGIKGRTIAKTSRAVGDILCCMSDGRWLEIEVKTGKDVQSPGQIERQKEIEKRNGVYLLIKTFDDFEKQYVSYFR